MMATDPEQREQLTPLDYQSYPENQSHAPNRHSDSEQQYLRGATIPARIVAGLFCIFFLYLAVIGYREIVAAVGCVALSTFCFFVAAGRIGKHKRGWI